MKRLCFLSPDIEHARKVVADLMNNGIPEKHIYVVAREDVELQELPDAGPEDDDFLPAYERGLAMGGSAGLIVGLLGIVFPPAGLTLGGGAALLITVFGAGVGGILTGLAGAAFPNSRLRKFEEAIEQGQLLVMADVPKAEAEDYKALISEFDPDVTVEGFEPPTRLIPR